MLADQGNLFGQFYPSLNRSSCCSKSICTDCYLQIKSTCYTPYGNCPFCKTAKYMVEYRGAKTAEERYFEQAEEQKVIEAKIRIRQKELRDEEQFVKEGEDIPVEERYLASRRGHGLGSDSENFHRYQESFELEESQLSGEFDFYEESRQHPNGEDDTYLDMEEELLLKAIEMSIKDLQQGREESALSPRSVQDSAMPGCGSRRRRRNGGSSGLHDAIEINSQVASGSKSVVDSQNFSQGRSVNCGDFDTRSDTIEIPQRCFGAHGATRKDEAALLGKTEMQNFSSQTCQDFHEKLIRSSGTAYVIPENYDEQIMLAMALSLADDYV